MYWDSDSLPMRFVGLTPFVPVSAELVNHALPLILDIAPIGTIAMLTLVRPRLAPMAIPMLGELRRCVNGELSGSVWKRALELAEQNCDCHYYRSLLRHAPIPLTHWWLSMKFNWMRSRGADLPTFRMLDLILERAVDLAIRSAPRHAHGLSFVYYASIILGLPKFPDLREWCYLDELIPIPTVDNTFHHRIRGKWCPPIAKTFCGKPVILNSTPDEYNDAPSLTDSILRDGRFVHPTCLQSLEGPWYEVGVTLADFPRGDDAETEIDRLRRKTGRNALVRQIISLHGRRPEALLPHLHRLGDHALAREIIDRCPDKNRPELVECFLNSCWDKRMMEIPSLQDIATRSQFTPLSGRPLFSVDWYITPDTRPEMVQTILEHTDFWYWIGREIMCGQVGVARSLVVGLFGVNPSLESEAARMCGASRLCRYLGMVGHEDIDGYLITRVHDWGDWSDRDIACSPSDANWLRSLCLRSHGRTG
ncbi:hypothetical protein Pelo_10689 [Pelomyxa schiedti]|nr:hypothetical protein Pelo_10689 [Pelomyxa schiedti]